MIIIIIIILLKNCDGNENVSSTLENRLQQKIIKNKKKLDNEKNKNNMDSF